MAADFSLIAHSRQPYNAEPRLDRLRASYVTAQSDFYVRCHGTIPRLDESRHHLVVTGVNGRSTTLSMADVRQRFPARTVMAVMQCAGNRRAEMHSLRPVSGDLWAGGAIGNAAWTGVALRDVLAAVDVPNDPALHVAFQSCDEIEMPGEGRFHYGASIPLGKAMAPDVLLAYAMNNEPLTPEHGFPLRVVVPGFAGARSPKWLSAIAIHDRPSNNHMQQRDYKLLPPDVTSETVDWSRGVTINDMPLNAMICEPEPNASLKRGRTTVRGYATATARDIVRCDVSGDGGRSWVQAELEHDRSAPWSWTFWQTTLDLPPGDHVLVVRAWDSAGQTQPGDVADIWNWKGYLCGAWHRVPVSVG